MRALRGLVRLKTLIQGQSVERQVNTTLQCMQTLARVQSQIQARRIRILEENRALQRQLQQKHEKEFEKLKSGYKRETSGIIVHNLSSKLKQSFKASRKLL